MDLEKIAGGDLATDKELEEVAAKIQPLPLHIVPSEKFVAQMRLRLLNLPAQRTFKAA